MDSNINLFTLFATEPVIILEAAHMEISPTPLTSQHRVVAISHTFLAFHFRGHFATVFIQNIFNFGVG
jgi:hypothetical protein